MSKHKEQKNNKPEIEIEEKIDQEFDIQKDTSEGSSLEKTEISFDEQLSAEKDKFLRLFAEFENYKRRTIKERLDLFKSANKELMTALLPVLDDFDRALIEIKKAEDDVLFKGVELISLKFRNTLEQKGLTWMTVQAGDVFDADLHQAITQIPAPTPNLKGKIIDVVEQGYTLGENIIRFPKVVVGN